MKYFVILTLSLGTDQVTTILTTTADATATRADIFNHVRNNIVRDSRDERWLKAATLFFSAEPNTLG
jgi:hypothetical protein